MLSAMLLLRLFYILVPRFVQSYPLYLEFGSSHVDLKGLSSKSQEPDTRSATLEIEDWTRISPGLPTIS